MSKSSKDPFRLYTRQGEARTGSKSSFCRPTKDRGPLSYVFYFFFYWALGKKEKNTPPTREKEKEKCSAVSFFFTMRDPSPSQDGHMQTATLKRKRGVTLSERVPCFFSLHSPFLPFFLFLFFFPGLFCLATPFWLRYRIDSIVRRRQTRLCPPLNCFNGLASRTVLS